MSANFVISWKNYREVVENLISEYKAAERPDYVEWGKENVAMNEVDPDASIHA